jgi:hypothetical protein
MLYYFVGFPAGLLASFPSKLNTFRKRVKNVVTYDVNSIFTSQYGVTSSGNRSCCVILEVGMVIKSSLCSVALSQDITCEVPTDVSEKPVAFIMVKDYTGPQPRRT